MSRFANREQTYSELLISIADYERKIDSHKKENEELNSKMNALKSMLMQPVMGKTMIGTFNIKEDIQEVISHNFFSELTLPPYRWKKNCSKPHNSIKIIDSLTISSTPGP